MSAIQASGGFPPNAGFIRMLSEPPASSVVNAASRSAPNPIARRPVAPSAAPLIPSLNSPLAAPPISAPSQKPGAKQKATAGRKGRKPTLVTNGVNLPLMPLPTARKIAVYNSKAVGSAPIETGSGKSTTKVDKTSSSGLPKAPSPKLEQTETKQAKDKDDCSLDALAEILGIPDFKNFNVMDFMNSDDEAINPDLHKSVTSTAKRSQHDTPVLDPHNPFVSEQINSPIPALSSADDLLDSLLNGSLTAPATQQPIQQQQPQSHILQRQREVYIPSSSPMVPRRLNMVDSSPIRRNIEPRLLLSQTQNPLVNPQPPFHYNPNIFFENPRSYVNNGSIATPSTSSARNVNSANRSNIDIKRERGSVQVRVRGPNGTALEAPKSKLPASRKPLKVLQAREDRPEISYFIDPSLSDVYVKPEGAVKANKSHHQSLLAAASSSPFLPTSTIKPQGSFMGGFHAVPKKSPVKKTQFNNFTEVIELSSPVKRLSPRDQNLGSGGKENTAGIELSFDDFLSSPPRRSPSKGCNGVTSLSMSPWKVSPRNKYPESSPSRPIPSSPTPPKNPSTSLEVRGLPAKVIKVRNCCRTIVDDHL
ncbi:hypothetical protein HDU97_000151 [Phlyctochytrium planicorne]|nr:hypothetical protein HDU97_000151 [Phlyctochytrium planicorne]